MIAVERLSLKLQQWFGDDFKIIPYQDLCRDYTTATQVVENGNVGYVMDYTDDYSKLKKEKIIGVVNLQNPQMANTSLHPLLYDHMYYITSGLNIDFSVPINTVKRDINNENIGGGSLDFFTRYEIVYTALKFTKMGLGYVNFATSEETEQGIQYKGNIVLNEPTFVGLEDDGEVKYANYRISGAFAISRDAIFGAEYKVSIKSGGTYYEILGINSFEEQLVNNGNAINKQGSTKTEQNLADSSWVCTITFDDYSIASGTFLHPDVGKEILLQMVHQNKEIIYPNEASESKKRKVPVKIVTPHGDTHEFDAIVNITFRTTANGVGSYAVSFTDDNKG